jgi:hypothetical protein
MHGIVLEITLPEEVTNFAIEGGVSSTINLKRLMVISSAIIAKNLP